MPRYFMRGTRLDSLERMMMDPSRSDSSPEEPQQCKPRKKPSGSHAEKPSGPERRPKEGGV